MKSFEEVSGALLSKHKWLNVGLLVGGSLQSEVVAAKLGMGFMRLRALGLFICI